MQDSRYMEFIKKISQKECKDYLSFVVSGQSMEPLIPNKKRIKVRLLRNNDVIKVNDIIVFFKFSTHYTVHRVINVIYDSDGNVYYQTKGDNNHQIDSYVVKRDEVIGIVEL